MTKLEPKILELLEGTTPTSPLGYESLVKEFPSYMKLAVVQAVSLLIEQGKATVWCTVDLESPNKDTTFWISLYDNSAQK